MDIIFNELSEKFLGNDVSEAEEWMNDFFSTATEFGKRVHKKIFIRTCVPIKGCFVAPNYTIGQWLQSIRDRERLRKILVQLTYKPLLSRYPYYYFEGELCDGLGIAAYEKSFTISYPSNKWEKILSVEKEYFSQDESVRKELLEVQNISSSSDIEYFFPKLLFEHHKKHDNRRSNLNDGQSTLRYNLPEDLEKVQKLLDCSFGEGKRFSWDEENEGYIEFQCHIGNKWHGYHIDEIERVPNDIKKQIEKWAKFE